MADLPPDDTGRTEHRAGAGTTGMPRWVKGFVAVGVLVLALLIMSQVMGGGHGPGRHGGKGETPTEDGGHTPPVDHGP